MKKTFCLVILAAGLLSLEVQAQDGTNALVWPLQKSYAAVQMESSPYCVMKIGRDAHAFNHKDVDKINKQWISSVEVYKDAKALELYGEKAKDGVVIINIKEEYANQALEFLNKKE
ncbi:hypothetical protein GU926_01360 [Nibribacter ruber]|uniref:TonB-dependent receptor plug domain-containing protein n=1 Tax=Nibribacter ruber TaxID=2698458 RepID=A0A6P1NWJ0_9BACT|nr:hypothetical protein [Nibribacter ruber]QHL86165.1 hypothetical protein GU926_01360 [Nibribacter ruber]